MQNKHRKIPAGALVVGLFAFVAAFFSACTSGDEAEVQDALDFLYAGMPLPDSVDYPRER